MTLWFINLVSCCVLVCVGVCVCVREYCEYIAHFTVQSIIYCYWFRHFEISFTRTSHFPVFFSSSVVSVLFNPFFLSLSLFLLPAYISRYVFEWISSVSPEQFGFIRFICFHFFWVFSSANFVPGILYSSAFVCFPGCLACCYRHIIIIISSVLFRFVQIGSSYLALFGFVCFDKFKIDHQRVSVCVCSHCKWLLLLQPNRWLSIYVFLCKLQLYISPLSQPLYGDKLNDVCNLICLQWIKNEISGMCASTGHTYVSYFIAKLQQMDVLCTNTPNR